MFGQTFYPGEDTPDEQNLAQTVRELPAAVEDEFLFFWAEPESCEVSILAHGTDGSATDKWLCNQPQHPFRGCFGDEKDGSSNLRLKLACVPPPIPGAFAIMDVFGPCVGDVVAIVWMLFNRFANFGDYCHMLPYNFSNLYVFLEKSTGSASIADQLLQTGICVILEGHTRSPSITELLLQKGNCFQAYRHFRAVANMVKNYREVFPEIFTDIDTSVTDYWDRMEEYGGDQILKRRPEDQAEALRNLVGHIRACVDILVEFHAKQEAENQSEIGKVP